jgi:ribosomal protein L37AE/L43A
MLGISDAVELTKKIGELVKAGVTLGLQETIVELREAVMNAKDEVLQLREENQAMRLKASEKAVWEATAAKYTLVAAPGGAMVYRTEEAPAHYACPRCYEEQKRAILQDRRVASGTYDCPECKRNFNVGAVQQYSIGVHGAR